MFSFHMARGNIFPRTCVQSVPSLFLDTPAQFSMKQPVRLEVASTLRLTVAFNTRGELVGVVLAPGDAEELREGHGAGLLQDWHLLRFSIVSVSPLVECVFLDTSVHTLGMMFREQAGRPHVKSCCVFTILYVQTLPQASQSNLQRE